MAEEDGYGALEDLDFEWLYVEDDYPLSDELAEMQIPDPGYAGTNFEIYCDHEDNDWLGYWEEREYVDDEYWDNAQLGALATKPTAKRKHVERVVESPNAKRRRVLMESIENVKYVSLAERLERFYEIPPRLVDAKPFALLPDWRERFANETGLAVQKAMPEAMKKASEAQGEDTPPKERRFDALVEEEKDGDWTDEDDNEDEDEDKDGDGDEDEDLGAMAAQFATLDNEMLHAVLQQKLGDAGLGNIDAGAFMSTITQMISGGGDANDATGDLANNLLGQALQGNDSALSGWLSQQGISLDAAVEDDDDVSSVATAEMPSHPGNLPRTNVQVSPPDSAIDISRQTSDAKRMPIHDSSPSASGKKRAASKDPIEGSSTKPKRVTFDVPTSSQSDSATAMENGEVELEPGTPHSTEPITEAVTSTHPQMSTATSDSTATVSIIDAAVAKSANDGAVKANGVTSTRATGMQNYAKPTAAASARQTRKRKVEADEDNIGDAAPKQKRPARKAAEPEPVVRAVEPAGRRTRSARAKAGR